MFEKFKNRNSRDGFTLIELLIGIVIFVMFLGVVSSSYISIVRSQRHANEVRRMYSDVRNFMDYFAEEVRLSAVDYGCYELNNNFIQFVSDADYCSTVNAGSMFEGKTDHLALIKKGGREKVFMKVDDNRLKVLKYIKTESGGWAPVPGYEDYKDFFSDGLEVKNLTFAIFPDVNPYSDDVEIYTDNGTQFQPKVTMFLSVQNSEDVQTVFDYDFQTTISSRVYSRKI